LLTPLVLPPAVLKVGTSLTAVQAEMGPTLVYAKATAIGMRTAPAT